MNSRKRSRIGDKELMIIENSTALIIETIDALDRIRTCRNLTEAAPYLTVIAQAQLKLYRNLVDWKPAIIQERDSTYIEQLTAEIEAGTFNPERRLAYLQDLIEKAWNEVRSLRQADDEIGWAKENPSTSGKRG